MAQLISEVWAGLRDAGLPEVMLYLADHSASRCHWDDTAVINEVRVAFLADQDRQIVRIVPVDSCVGIGVASPKGVDPSGYKMVVQNKLQGHKADPEVAPLPEPASVTPAPPPFHRVASPVQEPPDPSKPGAATDRWGGPLRAAPASRFGGAVQGNGA